MVSVKRRSIRAQQIWRYPGSTLFRGPIGLFEMQSYCPVFLDRSNSVCTISKSSTRARSLGLATERNVDDADGKKARTCSSKDKTKTVKDVCTCMYTYNKCKTGSVIFYVRAQELCESRGGLPGFPGLCGRKATLQNCRRSRPSHSSRILSDT